VKLDLNEVFLYFVVLPAGGGLLLWFLNEFRKSVKNGRRLHRKTGTWECSKCGHVFEEGEGVTLSRCPRCGGLARDIKAKSRRAPKD